MCPMNSFKNLELSPFMFDVDFVEGMELPSFWRFKLGESIAKIVD